VFSGNAASGICIQPPILIFFLILIFYLMNSQLLHLYIMIMDLWRTRFILSTVQVGMTPFSLLGLNEVSRVRTKSTLMTVSGVCIILSWDLAL
jgi:hypothetical protein